MAKIDRTTMILAVILSFFLWLYVHVMLGTPEKVRIITDVPVTPMNALAPGYLYQLHKDSRNIVIKLKGPEELVNNVMRDDLVASIDLAKLPIDLSKVTEQTTTTIEPVVTKLPHGVRLIEAPKVTLIVYPSDRKDFPVTAAFIPPPPPGTTVGEYQVDPPTVTVEGSSSDVDKVKYIMVRVDPNQPLKADRSIIPIPVDDDGKPVNGVSVSSPTVMLHMASPTGKQQLPAHH